MDENSIFYKYYGNIKLLGKPLHFLSLENKDLENFKQTLDSLLNNNIPVYITSVGLFAYDPGKKFSSMIKENYNLEIVGTELYEDWHKGVLKKLIFNCRLIRIRKKTSNPNSIL